MATRKRNRPKKKGRSTKVNTRYGREISHSLEELHHNHLNSQRIKQSLSSMDNPKIVGTYSRIPHMIKVIDMEVFNKHKENCIVVSDWYTTNNGNQRTRKSYYSKIDYVGKSITEKYAIGNHTADLERVDVQQIKNGYIVILTRVVSLKEDPLLLFTYAPVDVDENNEYKSCYACLFICCHQMDYHNDPLTFLNNKFHSTIKKAKNNILHSQKEEHFGSTGDYYGSGLHASYKRITAYNLLSIDRYACKGKLLFV